MRISARRWIAEDNALWGLMKTENVAIYLWKIPKLFITSKCHTSNGFYFVVVIIAFKVLEPRVDYVRSCGTNSTYYAIVCKRATNCKFCGEDGCNGIARNNQPIIQLMAILVTISIVSKHLFICFHWCSPRWLFKVTVITENKFVLHSILNKMNVFECTVLGVFRMWFIYIMEPQMTKKAVVELFRIINLFTEREKAKTRDGGREREREQDRAYLIMKKWRRSWWIYWGLAFSD